jgi:predicted RNase H-like HicB family nuclease
MRKFTIIIEKTETGFGAYVPDLPRCIATGRTKSSDEKNLYEAIQFHHEGLKESNIVIPANK